MYDSSTTNPYIKELSKATREENVLVPQKHSNSDLKSTSQQGYTSRTYVDCNGFKVIEYKGSGYSMILKYKPDYVEYTYNRKIIYNGPCDATFFTAGLIDPNGLLFFDKSMKELDAQLAEWDRRFNDWEKSFELSNADIAELMHSQEQRKRSFYRLLLLWWLPYIFNHFGSFLVRSRVDYWPGI